MSLQVLCPACLEPLATRDVTTTTDGEARRFVDVCPRCQKIQSEWTVEKVWGEKRSRAASDKLDVAEAFRALDELIARLGPTADLMTERDKAHWIAGYHAGHARRTPPPATKKLSETLGLFRTAAAWLTITLHRDEIAAFVAEWPEQK